MGQAPLSTKELSGSWCARSLEDLLSYKVKLLALVKRLEAPS